MTDIKVSIAIPAYDYHGHGGRLITDLLRTISQQQGFKPGEIELVVSDHSVEPHNDVKSMCRWYGANTDLTVKHHRNKENIGNSPANLNKAISICNGTVIKIMFQDDLFYNAGALKMICERLTQSADKQWLVCGCNHTADDGQSFYWDLVPEWNDNILEGVNTISSPSVVAIRNGTEIRFDENLVMMMDCEFYYAMNEKYGQPVYLSDKLVTNRVHQQQISYQFNEDQESRDVKLKKEVDYCFAKFHS